MQDNDIKSYHSQPNKVTIGDLNSNNFNQFNVIKQQSVDVDLINDNNKESN